MTSNQFIAEALGQYKARIEEQRPFENSVSHYRVDKPWGWEIWLDLNEHYAYKMIHMKAGNQSSLQSHEFKLETNYVIEGEAEVLLECNGNMQSHKFKSGSGWVVRPHQKHRVIALTDYTALEVSTPHLNDISRYQDDAGRGDGKIEAEHS